ncbi:MAG: F0F1 ATP synthase subunit epsilon [Bacteroidetes bacterium]|nr:F0F1 ATP synthase subunit epsilon [Bacteroidota bacterium]
MKLDILSPEEAIFSGEVDAVSLPGISGRFQLLNHHAAIISALGKGEIVYITKDGKAELKCKINGGVVEMLNNKVVVLID